ncbi:MAG: PKD domain-containing protein, partial [Deltaproteobacteria bacterium]|nr:PKD domain-containing protein [Deltaproteobacteria bacterium]
MKAYVLIVLVLGCVNLPGALGMPSADDITLDFEDCGHDTPLGDYEGISWDEGWTVYDVTATDCYIGSDPASEPYVAASHFSGSDATYDKLGFDFPSRVVFVGAWFSGAFYLLYPIDLAMSVELIGYVDGVQTFFSGARSLPAWDGNSFPMTFIELNWPGVDRVEVIPKDAYGGPGYFAMDDVIYRDSGTPGAYAGGVPGTDWPHTKRYSAYEGSVTVLDAGLSYDPDGDSLEYRWDIGEDGDWDTGWSGEPTLSRVFTSSTSFIVEVSDGVNTDWDRAYVDFIRLLEAGFTWSPEPPQADVDIQFTDTSTSYPDEIVAWSWDFGDGSTSTEQNPIHAFDLAGKYTVTLTVTDEDGDSDSVEEILNLGGVTKRYAFTNFYDCDPWTELTEYRGITWDPGWYAVGEYIEFPIVGEIPWTTTWMGVAAGNFDEEWYLDEEWYSTEPTLATTYGLDFPCIVDVYEA